ncbi:hypothetical protein [Desulfobacter latus]|uniref:Uncharacterized protein n=1 Tax=Desulfobacter latus TaxID=2292 RepID=A0A850SZG1_9BACT|nr:hypothetical protein [Desulfobacter latus]NWH05510.1 hypothetical protein [Desulfobacter latus]
MANIQGFHVALVMETKKADGRMSRRLTALIRSRDAVSRLRMKTIHAVQLELPFFNIIVPVI